MRTMAPATPPPSRRLPPPAPPRGRFAVVALVVAMVVVIIGIAITVAVATFDIDRVEEHTDHRSVDGGQCHECPLYCVLRGTVGLHHEQALVTFRREYNRVG